MPLPVFLTICLIATLLLAAATAHAQFSVFGKNKVQYTDFEWQALKGEHFDLYFYPDEEDLARHALAMAEESYTDLATFFGHEVRRRIPLIIYASHQHFEQTNVIPFFLPEGVAGLTELLKGRVLIPFSGSYSQFRTVLHHELVHVFQLSIQSSLYRQHFNRGMAYPPLWLTEGTADYLSGRMMPQGEMVLSDLVIAGRLPPIRGLWRYNGTFALYKLGQSVVTFIAETYGTDAVARLYENLWISQDFNDVLEWVTGVSEETLSDQWHQYERRNYYPMVQDRHPVGLEARLLAGNGGANFKPVEIPSGVLEEEGKYIFVSPRTGYTNIYMASLGGEERDVEVLVKGERQAEFESLHPFVSKVDVSADGRLAFVSKWNDKDALFVFDVKRREVIGRYRFRDLVALTSPAWSLDGRRVVFQGLTVDAQSDLYMFEPESGELTRLTNDRYQDVDPDFSPDGRTIVFASDRTEHGRDAALNLFLLEIESRNLRYLTRGPWRDEAPRFSADGEKVYFSSSRDGLPDLCEVDLEGRGRRLTTLLGGGMDPSPTEDGATLLFTGYSNGAFRIYSLPIPADSVAAFELVGSPVMAGWRWDDAWQEGRAEPDRYRRRFTLDFAQGGVAFDPYLPDAQGVQAALTDMLGDEIVFLQLGNTSGRSDRFVKRFSAGVTYFNLRRRLNYGVSTFHYAGDFLDDRDLSFFERRAGVSFIASYPFSKFKRIETSLGLIYSDKRHPLIDIDRRAWLATNSFSWVHDTSLWIPTGPVDGVRAKAAIGLTLDPYRAETEGLVLVGDYRRYIRTGQRSTWATRLQGRFSFGSDPRYWTLGGSHSLRGYPYRELFATRSLLFNNEYRFPIVEGFVIGFPFGAIEFPGIESAAFVDAGLMWNANESVDWPPLGSFGLSFRMSFGGFLVFRLDFARRTDFTSVESGTHTDFFIGWDY